MESRRNKGEPDYYGSLERLPLAPVRGKPPPYASRRQQGGRRGNLLKGNRGISSSTGDLSSRSRTASSSSNEGDGEGWGGSDGGGGDLGTPVMSRDSSDAPTAMPAHHQHQRHGSVSYSSVEHPSEDHITFTPTHQRHGSVSYSMAYIIDDSDERDESRSNTDSSDTSHIQPEIQEQGYSRREQGLIQNRIQKEQKQGSGNVAQDNGTQQRHNRREHSLTQNKTQEKQKEESKKSQERLRPGAGDTKDSDATSPTNTAERRSRSGSTSITNSLKNYRELAAIPDHTLVKWERSKSMNDVTGDDDAKDSDEEGKSKGEMKRAQSFDAKYAGDVEEKNARETRGRERYSSTTDMEERNTSERRRVASYSNTKNTGVAEKKNEWEMRHRERYSSTNDDKEDRSKGEMRHRTSYKNTLNTGYNETKNGRDMTHRGSYSSTKDDMEGGNKGLMRYPASYNDTATTGIEGRSRDGTKQTARPLPGTNKSEDQIAKNEGRGEETRHFERYLLVTSKTKDEAESVSGGKGTMQRNHHIVTSPSSSSSSSSSASSPSHSPRQSVQGGGKDNNTGDGVFVATPIFLEGSPSSSPPPSIPMPSTGHQGSLTRGTGEDPLVREKDSALSTLRKEIQHLTRLKEEIEQNLLKSQAELKEQVAGLREERGGMEAVMDQREKRLHAQEEEIKDLKDTIAQLQTLMFTSDGEARLQRQASDLQEQLREERRYRQEETKQLRREVRALTSRLQEKEQQLAKYKSDPTLSSWGSEMPSKETVGSWKTSLPDVRTELSPTSLGVSVAERRRSFSSLSDCSDDSRFSTAGSFIFRKAQAKENASGRPNGTAGRSYKAVETSGKPYIAPVNDSRSRSAAMTSGKFDKAPIAETRPRGVSARLDKTVESSGKPNIAPVSHSRLNEAPTRLSSTTGPSRKADKAPAIETRQWRASARPDGEMEVSRRSDIAAKGDSLLRAVPLRLETTVESSRAPCREAEPDLYHIGSRKPLVTSGSVASLDLPPTSLTVPLGDTILGNTADSQRFESGDGGRTRVKTAVYMELGDYTKPGAYEGGERKGEFMSTRNRGLGEGVYEGGREGEYIRTGNRGFEGGLREGNYKRHERAREGRYEPGHKETNYAGLGGVDGSYERPGTGRERGYKGLDGNHAVGQKERDYVRSGYEQELKTPSQNPVTKSTVPSPAPRHHTTSSGQPPHVSRPVTAPPQPPQFTRTPTLQPQPSGTSQVTKQTPQPPQQITRSFPIPTHGKIEGQARLASGGEYGRRNEQRGLENGRRETDVPRIVGYVRKTEAGVQRAVENGRRETEAARGVDYGRKMEAGVQKRVENVRRDTEMARGEEHGRKTSPERQREMKNGRRETAIARVEGYGKTNDLDRPRRVENGRWSNQEAQRGVDDRRNQDSALRGGGVRVSDAGNTTPNTSYITATVLCLYNLPYLRHFFAAEFPGLGIRSEVPRAVSGVFSALESGIKDGRALHHLREAIGLRNKIFQLHQDPAAADFLSCLLVWLHDDLTPEVQTQGPSAAASVVSRTFHGLRESLITCPKRGEILSAAMEFFNIITLSLPGEGAWTLQELLARRFQAKEMAWECRLCGRRHPCTHQLHLLQPPRVLLLHLWRPSVGAAAARVLFPEGGLVLNLHHHHHHHHQQKDRILRSREYHLVGVVTREADNGSSTHSAFYRRLEGGGGWQAWREQRVSAVSRREVLSQQSAHLLFYVQQEGESQQASGSSRGRGEATRGGTRHNKIYNK